MFQDPDAVVQAFSMREPRLLEPLVGRDYMDFGVLQGLVQSCK